eukprot:3895737-Karenia_brevis.AAC.1
MARLLHMWMKHKAESQGTCMNVCHVNAHSDHPWNPFADSLARMAATSEFISKADWLSERR